MAYVNDQVGKIVVIRNIVFACGDCNNVHVDHAWRTGRPCLVLYSDDGYDYVLPLKHELKNLIYEYKFFKLDSSMFLYQLSRDNRINYNASKTKKLSNSFVNLEYVYKVPICGHLEVGKINLPAYRDLVNQYIKLHSISELDELSNDKNAILCR